MADDNYFNRLRLIKLGLLPKEAVPKKKVPLRAKSLKKQAEEAEQKKSASAEGKDQSLDEWFQKIENLHWGEQDLDADGFDHSEGEPIIVRCMECNTPISRLFARHATAHLLPKKLFDSIKTNDLNYLILGAGCGCHNKTHRLDTFVKMKVWPIAKERIIALLPLLPYDELKFVSQQLYDVLESNKK